jgi:hypothetical protein
MVWGIAPEPGAAQLLLENERLRLVFRRSVAPLSLSPLSPGDSDNSALSRVLAKLLTTLEEARFEECSAGEGFSRRAQQCFGRHRVVSVQIIRLLGYSYQPRPFSLVNQNR